MSAASSLRLRSLGLARGALAGQVGGVGAVVADGQRVPVGVRAGPGRPEGPGPEVVGLGAAVAPQALVAGRVGRLGVVVLVDEPGQLVVGRTVA